MKKYLFIDTNIFIQCSFLEIEDGDNLESLEKLIKLLKDDTHLILPEIVKLEVFSKLEEKKQEVEKKFSELKSKTKDVNLGNKYTQDINSAISKVHKDRLENYELVINKIKEIFNNTNVIELPLKSEHICKAYKYFITKKKPFTTKNISNSDGKYVPSIQSDCLIIISIQEFFDLEKEYEFYFCSSDGDYFENEKKVNIHSDIKSIIKIDNNDTNLLKILNENFGVEFSENQIRDFEKEYINLFDNSLRMNNSGVTAGISAGETNESVISKSDIAEAQFDFYGLEYDDISNTDNNQDDDNFEEYSKI